MKKTRLLVIGARGRLGSIFCRNYGQFFDIVEFGARPSSQGGIRPYVAAIEELSRIFERWVPEVVLNLAAKWGPGVSEDQIHEVSVTMPMSVVELLRGHQVRWVQVDSYFNLYFDMFGEDKDVYSRAKRLFIGQARDLLPVDSLTQVIAPHLVGRAEPPGRLFPTIVSGLISRTPFRLGSGKQYVPFLHYEDAAAQLGQVITAAAQKRPPINLQRVQLRHVDCLTVAELVSKSRSYFGLEEGFAVLGGRPDEQREFYEEIPTTDVAECLRLPSRTLEFVLGEQEDEFMCSIGGQG